MGTLRETLLSYLGPLLASIPWGWLVACAACLSVGWWGCWWMVVRNNPGVDLQAPRPVRAAQALQALLAPPAGGQSYHKRDPRKLPPRPPVAPA